MDTDAWTSPGSEAARAADREAVNSAEQAVGDAWIGRLLVAESETEAVADACARVRERAADQVRAAQRSGDLAGLAQAQTDLELADTASRRAQQKHEFAGAILTRELETWSKATAHRVRLALSDRSGATRR